jgi:hypothetical protein
LRKLICSESLKRLCWARVYRWITWIVIAKMELHTGRIEWLPPRWALELDITLMAHLFTALALLKKVKLADLEIDP